MKLLVPAFLVSAYSRSGACREGEYASSTGVALLQSHFLTSRLGRSDDDGGDDDDKGDASSASQVQRRHALEPIFYVHVPKCGSSFATALAHLECGDKIDEELTIKEPGPTEKWNENCGDGSFSRFEMGHDPLHETMTDKSLGKVVTMFRPPQSRISSGYIHNLHDCYALQKKYKIKHQDAAPWQPDGEVDPAILKEYAKCVNSCMTNILVGRGCANNGEAPSAKQQASDRRKALERLPKLGFVGLTAHWDLSICLWHAKFGGECLPAEFANVRPARAQYSEGHVDEALIANDQEIYDRAEELFAKELEKYDVTPESCAKKYCPRVADLFGGRLPEPEEGSSAVLMKYTKDSLKTLTWPGRMLYDED